MDLLNQTIGKYKLTRFIGEGGMATVYEGTHAVLGNKAAVKVLNPLLAKNLQFKQRFQNEAAFMASLDHPNITKVIDFEETEDHLAIIMELLEGMDLSDWVKQNGPFTFDAFKPIFSQVLEAFNYAHNKGILHRDIKPSNIFIDPTGKVKILDFGIAKMFGTGNEMTQTGTQMGTPAYMSPEQVRADKSIDHRSDIYSLGVTLYFALAGKPPYDTENESQFDIFNKIVFEALPDFPADQKADGLIKKACDKDRNVRFQHVQDFQLALFDGKIPDNTVATPTSKNNQATKLNKDVIGNSNSASPSEVKKKSSKKKMIPWIVLGVIGIGVLVVFTDPKLNAAIFGGEKKGDMKKEGESGPPAETVATEDYPTEPPAAEVAPEYYEDVPAEAAAAEAAAADENYEGISEGDAVATPEAVAPASESYEQLPAIK